MQLTSELALISIVHCLPMNLHVPTHSWPEHLSIGQCKVQLVLLVYIVQIDWT